MSRDAVTNSIQTWVEIINTPTKGAVMHDESTAKVSEKPEFGPGGWLGVAPSDFERDLYELRKLADEVLDAVAANGAQGLAFRGAKGALPYERPELEFTLPMPAWPK